jgi:hypothetical protein
MWRCCVAWCFYFFYWLVLLRTRPHHASPPTLMRSLIGSQEPSFRQQAVLDGYGGGTRRNCQSTLLLSMSNTHERGEYEKEREQNIKRNSDFLRTLGMDEDTAALRAAAAADKGARKRPKTNKPAHTAPPRRGARNEGKVVKYTFDFSDRKLGIARESRPRGPGTVVWDNTAVPDAEKAEAATARAEAYAAQSEHANTERVCVKQLLKSHISGGFWLQLPSHFCKCMPDTILNPVRAMLCPIIIYMSRAPP